MKRLKFLLLFLFPWNLYSADLYNSVPPIIQQDTTDEIFYSVEAPLEPRDGIDAFFDRLTRHLKSSEELSQTYRPKFLLLGMI